MAKREIVVIGAGRFGTSVIEKLSPLPHYNIIAIDKNETNLRKLDKSITSIIGDASDEKFLDSLGIENSDIYIIGIGEDIQSSLLIASLIKEKYSGRIIAKCVNTNHEHILKRLGVEEIVNPELAAARRAVMKVISPLSRLKIQNEVIELEGDISIIRTLASEEEFGKEIRDLGFTKKTSIILLYRNNMPIVAHGDTKIKKDDELVILGENKTIYKIIQKLKVSK